LLLILLVESLHCCEVSEAADSGGIVPPISIGTINIEARIAGSPIIISVLFIVVQSLYIDIK
jgi:hypothetical protein